MMKVFSVELESDLGWSVEEVAPFKSACQRGFIRACQEVVVDPNNWVLYLSGDGRPQPPAIIATLGREPKVRGEARGTTQQQLEEAVFEMCLRVLRAGDRDID